MFKARLLRKSYKRYRELPQPVKASMWFMAASIVSKGISMFTTPMFTRLLTTEQYGIYSIYQSWYSIIAVFATLNLGGGVYNNGLIRFEADRARMSSSLLGLSTTVTLLFILIYACAMDFWNALLNMSTLFMLAIFLEALFVPAYTFWSVEQRFDYKYRNLVLWTLFIAFAGPILGVIGVVSTNLYKVEARVLSFVLVQISVGLVFYIRIFWRGRSFFSWKYWKFALRFNLPLIPHYLSNMLLGQSDRIMIARMVGSSQAAIYSVAYTVSTMMQLVTGAINSSFIPFTYKAIKENRLHRIKGNTMLLLAIVAIGCILAMAFGPEIIYLFAASEYYEARWVVPPVSAAVFFTFLYPLFGNIEFYYEKTKMVMVATSTAAAVNIALNYFTIQLFGYIAAAYTTLICYMILAFVHGINAHIILKKMGGSIAEVYDFKSILSLSALVCGVMVFMLLVYDYVLIRYLIIIGIGIYACCNRRKILEAVDLIRNRK